VKRRRIWGLCISFALVFSLLGGCSPKDKASETETAQEETAVSAEKMASSIREKYADSETVEYQEAISGIKRDQSLEIQMGFDIKNGNFDNYTQLVEVFQDAELTQSVGTHFDWNEETKVLSVTPPRWSIGTIANAELDEDAPGNNLISSHLFDKGELADWGNLPQYYLVQYVDAQTGEELEKPLVTVFTVEHEVKESPRVTMVINEEGLPTFSWDAVDGATLYYVLSMDYDAEKGYIGNGWVQGETADVSWTPEDATHLRIYDVSEAERDDDYIVEKYGEGQGAILQERLYDTYYCVIAVSEDGTSSISNTFSLEDIARKVPYTEEVKMSLDEEGSNIAGAFEQMPAYKWVTMCDGTLVQKIIIYDFEKAELKKETWGEYENPDMSDLTVKEVEVAAVPYRIDGTGYTGVVKVENFNAETWKEDLEKVKQRQEELRSRAGARTLNVVKEEKAGGTESEAVVEIRADNGITANSALSEYLAASMLSGQKRIDLTAFPESGDQEYLLDAWMEAVYQNPLILGVNGAAIIEKGRALRVSYDTDMTVMLRKQKEIKETVASISKEIITDEMTDLEKEFAINQYLCDTAEYDMAALENAEENDFATVDESFADSFTPYGVLVNKLGVCASYAGAFKLLADAAGLESIVVTGYLDGTTPHAWNKVKIDGEWQIVDSTNNDNEFVANALLNLPDFAADKVLVEDDLYALNQTLGTYSAIEEDKEYYRLNQRYFSESEIANPLADQLTSEGTAVYRTDYDLSDEMFNQIGQSVIDKTGNDSLYGFYWMGVIYLTENAME